MPGFAPTHLSIGSFSQNSKKLKAVWSNSLTVSVDTLTGQLHLLGLNTGIKGENDTKWDVE